MVGVTAPLPSIKLNPVSWRTNGTRPRRRQLLLHVKAADNSAEPSGGLGQQHNVPPPQKQQQGLQQPQHPSGAEQAAEQEQLWWVERFESKRKELEQQQPSNETTESSNATGQHQGNRAASMQPDRPSVPWSSVALQLLQLFAAVAALILWPASLYRTGLYNGKVWLLFLTYMLFFGVGTVSRMVKFGSLASRSKDKQAKSLGTRAAWLLFVATMPVLHWGCIGSYMKAKAAAAVAAAQQGAGTEAGAVGSTISSLALYDVIGLCLLAGAVWLNWLAARHLGKAYNRVVEPESLVTTGPYAWVQHPIYTSYIMLFCGYAMVLHSFGYAVLALVVCLVYYKSRVALEAEVLHKAFGEKYQEYQNSTKLFVPFVL